MTFFVVLFIWCLLFLLYLILVWLRYLFLLLNVFYDKLLEFNNLHNELYDICNLFEKRLKSQHKNINQITIKDILLYFDYEEFELTLDNINKISAQCIMSNAYKVVSLYLAILLLFLSAMQLLISNIVLLAVFGFICLFVVCFGLFVKLSVVEKWRHYIKKALEIKKEELKRSDKYTKDLNRAVKCIEVVTIDKKI